MYIVQFVLKIMDTLDVFVQFSILQIFAQILFKKQKNGAEVLDMLE